MLEREYELTANIEIIKRLLRYVRRQHTMTRDKMIKSMDITKARVNSAVQFHKGEIAAYESIEKIYESILAEAQSELSKLKGSTNE